MCQWCDISGRENVRSAEHHDMFVPSTRTQLDRRSFRFAAPAVWNALPSQLRSSSIIVVDSLELGLKPISSHRRTDTSGNFCWKAYYFTFTCASAWTVARVLSDVVCSTLLRRVRDASTESRICLHIQVYHVSKTPLAFLCAPLTNSERRILRQTVSRRR